MTDDLYYVIVANDGEPYAVRDAEDAAAHFLSDVAFYADGMADMMADSDCGTMTPEAADAWMADRMADESQGLQESIVALRPGKGFSAILAEPEYGRNVIELSCHDRDDMIALGWTFDDDGEPDNG